MKIRFDRDRPAKGRQPLKNFHHAKAPAPGKAPSSGKGANKAKPTSSAKPAQAAQAAKADSAAQAAKPGVGKPAPAAKPVEAAKSKAGKPAEPAKEKVGTLVVGTRGSALALTQSEMVCEMLREAHKGLEVRLEVIKTSGDADQRTKLSEFPVMGVFVKELQTALLAGTIDCAVHSLKDVPEDEPEGLMLAAFP